MADFEKVQLQVEVIRTQLDSLVKDVNGLKDQKLKLTVDSSGLEAINRFNTSVQAITQNIDGLSGKFTKVWAGAADDAPTRTIETVNEGLGRTTEIIRTLDEETQQYTTVQTKATTNYDAMTKAAQKAAEQNQKAAGQARAYLLTEEQAAQKAASVYNPTPMQQRIEALTGVSNATKSAAESAKVFEQAWADASGKSTAAAQQQAQDVENAASKVDTLRKGFADLGLQMKSAGEKYPAGTFSDIESDAKQASAALETLYNSWKSGTISDKEFVDGVKNASGSLKKLRANYAQTRNETDKLTNSTNVLGDTFSHIVGKITVWQVVNTAVAKVKRSFTEAIDTMKQVDTEMTAIQKVTGNTSAEMEKLGNTAYEAASKYGVAVTDYLESVGTFAKAGYKDMSEDMAELATKTQLVGDVTSSIANQFILSADAAFKFEGNVTALNTVLDKANEIENNYATSIQKMAEGFPIVANVASMANMSIDQLIAMLGTITAVTQESGTKAATAARALILNIIGDTETELEDGITWTKEEIESLNQVLWTYSEDAMKAAQATGSIVNPMEAVAGLAKAYKEGVLTQAELAQIESDLGGKLRTNQLDALIKNYDMYAAMLDKVANSAGSADKEVDVMLTSWDAKAKILNNTWTKFIADTVDTKWAKDFLDTLTWLIEGFGNLGTAVTIFGGVLVAFKWNSIVGSFKTLGSVIGALPMLFSSAKGGAAGFDAGMKALNVSLTSTQLLVGAIVVAISALVIAYNKYTQKLQETRQAAIDAGEAATKEAEEIASLYGEYKEYNDALKDSAEYKGEISGKTETLIEKLGLERDEIGKLVRQYGDLETAINKAAEAKLSSNLYDAKAATAASKANLEDQFQAMYVGSERIDAEEIVNLYNDLIEQRNKMIDSGQQESYMYKVTAERIETLKPLVDTYTQSKRNELEIENQIKAAKNGTLDLYGKEESELDDVTDSANDAADALADVEVATYDANTAAAKLTKSLFDANGKLTEHAKKALTTNTALADLAKKELELQNAAATANYNNLIAQIQAVGSSAIITSQQLQQMIGLIPGLTTNTWSAENQEFNMRRLFNQQTGKNWKKDAEDYAQWSSQYLLNKSSEYYKKQQEEYKKQMEELSKYTSDYTGTSTGGGGGSSSDANLESHKQKVELLKSELTLLEKQNASEDTQKDKMRQIQQALHAQAQYLRSIGGSQADINALSAEWWEWQEKINGTLKSTDDLLSELQDVMSDKLSDLSDQRQDELDAIDAQIDALKQQKDTRDEQLDLEEKILAVQQAQAKLANAQNERTIRQYNARTGQWEWVADQKEVDDAQEALDDAKKDLEDFKANMAYEAALAELESKKDAINAQYDALEKSYNNFLKSLKEKTRGIGEILQDIWKNATPELKKIIQENAELFKQFGFDVSELSDAVKETAKKLYGLSSNGSKYEIGSDKGIDFVNNAPAGSTMTGGDGSTWTKNADGTVTIVDKDGVSYTVNPNQITGDTTGDTTSGGQRYSGVVYGEPDDGQGERYKISSASGLDFLNNKPAGSSMTGGDKSYWVKNADGTTSITDRYGRHYTVYDQGGILHGMGGIKATLQDEGVTPPDVTELLKKRLLSPVRDANFDRNMDALRSCLSTKHEAETVSTASYDNHSIGTQHNGNTYQFGSVTISEQQANNMSVKRFADLALGLGNFS
jgi:TP901 family phage tail tape measure protein